MKQKQKANAIVNRLCESGWQAYIVGGAARDILCGDIPDDYDVVTNASYDVVKKLFRDRKLTIVGVSYKVCIVDGIEVSTYRKNGCFDKNGTDSDYAETIYEDLSYRDLTINAMAFCPYNGDIVDEFGGRSDLKNRIIKFTGNPKNRINEDPCRIIRACRFLAKLEGRFDPDTFDALKKYSWMIKDKVAPERIRLEIMKALQYSKPSHFFDALHQIGALENISPGFEACYDHDGGRYHGETIDEHIKIVGDSLSARKPLLRLAGYYHDHGKPAAAQYKDNILSFIDHAGIGARIIEKELMALKFSLREIAYVKALAKHHMLDISDRTTPKTVRKILKTLKEDNINWKDWLRLKMADIKGNLKMTNLDRKQIKDIVLKIYRELHPSKGSAVLCIHDLAINGDDVLEILEIKAGPEVGNILKKALAYVLDDPRRNSKDELIHYIKS